MNLSDKVTFEKIDFSDETIYSCQFHMRKERNLRTKMSSLDLNTLESMIKEDLYNEMLRELYSDFEITADKLAHLADKAIGRMPSYAYDDKMKFKKEVEYLHRRIRDKLTFKREQFKPL